MSSLSQPEAQAEFLVNHFKSKALAMKHAQWALNHVEKPTTKAFWEKVIEKLKP